MTLRVIPSTVTSPEAFQRAPIPWSRVAPAEWLFDSNWAESSADVFLSQLWLAALIQLWKNHFKPQYLGRGGAGEEKNERLCRSWKCTFHLVYLGWPFWRSSQTSLPLGRGGGGKVVIFFLFFFLKRRVFETGGTFLAMSPLDVVATQDI